MTKDKIEEIAKDVIVGSSLIALSDIPLKWHEIPIIGLDGFVFADVMGFWLLVSILRDGRLQPDDHHRYCVGLMRRG